MELPSYRAIVTSSAARPATPLLRHRLYDIALENSRSLVVPLGEPKRFVQATASSINRFFVCALSVIRYKK